MKKTYFNHDSNSRNDLRIIKLRAKLGYEGYGIFWSVLELLFTEENKLCVDDYTEIAFGLQCDPEKLKQVIEDFDLFVLDDGCFYSKRLHDHIEKINSKSEIAKENAKKRWSGKAVAEGSHTKGNASNSISNSNSNSKVKKSNYYNDIAFPDYYDIHYAKRIEQDINKTKEYHEHLRSIGYIQQRNNYNGETKWIKK
jgi:uncharacterized protein YdaU (DUF1376 family)|tara:strand:+ start:1290 stop:1880 length:591 start_codon:yes stop_codon:yes gene_type:complete